LVHSSDVNLVKNLSSSLQDYDALVVVATQLDDITEFVDSSVTTNLQLFTQVRITKQMKSFFPKLYF
jgi:hypothetical protein